MLILNRAEVERLLPMAKVLEAVRQGAAEFSAGRCIVPPRTRVTLDQQGNGTLFMPGYVTEPPILGQKVVSGFPRNLPNGLPRSHAVVLLLDVENGRADALIDATYITDARTGALTGVAADLLARKDARVLALFGAGQQAYTQVDALLAVRPIEELRVWSRTPERLNRLVAAVSQKYPALRVRAAASGEAAVDGADIVACATTTKQAAVLDAWIRPGMFLSSIGANFPDVHEFEPETVARADRVVVDARMEVNQKAGDIFIPLSRGMLDEERISELGEIVLGQRPGRERDDEITFFKSVGFATVDLITAHFVVQQARAQGVGLEVDVHGGR